MILLRAALAAFFPFRAAFLAVELERFITAAAPTVRLRTIASIEISGSTLPALSWNVAVVVPKKRYSIPTLA